MLVVRETRESASETARGRQAGAPKLDDDRRSAAGLDRSAPEAVVKRLLFFSLPIPLLVLGCNGKVTRDECTEMLDRYLDMTIAGDAELANLPPAEARAVREMKKAIRKAEPSYARVEGQCESEISKREYRCAMKAPTPETWQACID
jgi:hypothetical protein